MGHEVLLDHHDERKDWKRKVQYVMFLFLIQHNGIGQKIRCTREPNRRWWLNSEGKFEEYCLPKKNLVMGRKFF